MDWDGWMRYMDRYVDRLHLLDKWEEWIDEID